MRYENLGGYVRVVDIKATSKAERDWPLQVGAFQSMLDGPDVPIYRDERFRYFNDDNEQLMSVSGMLRELGIKKSFAGMEFADVVLHAIERGKVLENAIFAALASDNPTSLKIPAEWQVELGFRKDGKKSTWLLGYWNWLEEHQPKMVSCRQFVSDAEIRVAGEIDLVLDEDGPPAVLHLNPSFSRGFIFREYPDALDKWEYARTARLESLASFERARCAIEGM